MRAALQELWGLFVEDLSLTVGIACALVLDALVFPAFVTAPWRGATLCLLCALVLIENCWRSARRSRRGVNEPDDR